MYKKPAHLGHPAIGLGLLRSSLLFWMSVLLHTLQTDVCDSQGRKEWLL